MATLSPDMKEGARIVCRGCAHVREFSWGWLCGVADDRSDAPGFTYAELRSWAAQKTLKCSVCGSKECVVVGEHDGTDLHGAPSSAYGGGTFFDRLEQADRLRHPGVRGEIEDVGSFQPNERFQHYLQTF